MSKLNLNYEEASNRARIVEADADVIQLILNTLHDEVSSNINNENVYSGDAAKRFLDAWQKEADNFAAYVNHIKTIQQKIDFTAQEITKLDQA